MLRLLAIAALFGLAACASGDRIVLLPNEDGAPSTITVTNSGGAAVIDQPGAAVAVARPTSAPTPQGDRPRKNERPPPSAGTPNTIMSPTPVANPSRVPK